MNSKSVVLKKVEQLLQLKYLGSTPKNYLFHIDHFLTFSNNVPDRVNNEDILNYNIHIRNYGNSYRNIAINAIKAYFKLYLRKEVKTFSSIRPKKEYKIVTVYDALEMADKIRQIKNTKHKAILCLGLSGWLRVGEVINLKITDIDSSRMLIHIKQSKGAKDRDVTLTEEVLQVLRDYVKEYRPHDYIFNGQTNSKYSTSSCNKLCKQYLHPSMRFHALRATGATYASENGMSLMDVSTMLGHAKIETTKHYIPSRLKTSVQAL